MLQIPLTRFIKIYGMLVLKEKVNYTKDITGNIKMILNKVRIMI